ncbi:MAG: SpoIIIAH-like family protein [Clostridia bacterium]|nr:SpoIIIAH-like family protein [Clostridia bacterium]
MKTQSTALCEVKQNNKFRAIVVKIGKKNIAIACSVLLIGVAVLLNWLLFTPETAPEGYDGYDQPSGNISDNVTEGSGTADTDSYFSATLSSRQKARDEALEVLQAVVDSASSTEAAKAEALESIATIADEIQKEANIESLIMAKGFEDCIAVLNGDNASIIVKSQDLQAAEIAQINAIVYEQTGIVPGGVTIISK